MLFTLMVENSFTLYLINGKSVISQNGAAKIYTLQVL